MGNLDFDSALTRLEEIVEQLESSQLGLEESLAIFEEGVKIALHCQKELNKTDGKVQKLMKKLNGEFDVSDIEL